ncbi:MAK10-like protein [Tanacetum coccineum]|uniref:MAK10-like protein n=1 Tax=Tanacetum coccineum TaxID=301880 RepID=A0ABQ5B718_9ASTR
MGDENPIRTLRDYSKPSHEGYRNTIEFPVGNNVVPLRSDTIRLVQNGCSLHGLWSEDPNQHLKDFLKLVDSLDLDGENMERTCLRLFHFSLLDQASNWLERLPAGSITIYEDLTTRFLAQFFPPVRTIKLCNDILMFLQHHRESLSEAWTRFKDLLQKVPHHGIDLWLQDPTLYDNKSWNDPMDFAKPVKAITLPQDVPSTSDHRHIKLENQVQRLMEAHLALTQPTQVNKITTSCEICSGPHDTLYCMEDPEQTFVEYASSCTNEAGDTPLLERKDISVVGNLVSNKDDEGIKWLDVEEPLDLVDTSEESVYESLIKEMPKCSLNYDFRIKKDETKEITFKTQYKDPERSELSSEGHDLLSSRVILSEDDYDRGCRKLFDLEDEFYRDTIKLGPEYVTGMDDEGEVTLYLTRRSLEVLKKFHGMILGGRFYQLSHVSSPLLSKPGEY